ncbi:MAG: hypothetical protein ACLFP2_04240 [Candidatus Woesearchaeota archaeon]
MEKRFRCDICGKLSDKQEICCNTPMKDLLSPGCMGCRGCGMH